MNWNQRRILCGTLTFYFFHDFILHFSSRSPINLRCYCSVVSAMQFIFFVPSQTRLSFNSGCLQRLLLTFVFFDLSFNNFSISICRSVQIRFPICTNHSSDLVATVAMKQTIIWGTHTCLGWLHTWVNVSGEKFVCDIISRTYCPKLILATSANGATKGKIFIGRVIFLFLLYVAAMISFEFLYPIFQWFEFLLARIFLPSVFEIGNQSFHGSSGSQGGKGINPFTTSIVTIQFDLFLLQVNRINANPSELWSLRPAFSLLGNCCTNLKAFAFWRGGHSVSRVSSRFFRERNQWYEYQWPRL